jgi:Xaa-Pro aminopeptidase
MVKADAAEFARRRRHLLEMVGPAGIAILPAAPERVRSRDVHFDYRPDSDLYYVTGFREPEAVFVFMPGGAHGEFLAFCRERDTVLEMWNGVRSGPEGVIADFGADDAYPIADIDEILPGLIEPCERVYYSMGIAADFDQKLLSWISHLNANRQRGHAPSEIITLDHLLHEMRLKKSRRELAAMRRSAQIGVAAHIRAMQACRPGMYEYELEAEYIYEYRRCGAGPSYQPIVAGGANACILHYVTNDQPLDDGDLVLVDAGCELDMYASDITRTYPVNGQFSPAHKELYEIVLEANRAATRAAVAGNHWNDPHAAAVRVITLGLRDLGILSGRLPQLLKDAAYRPYFMHKTGHWLGMDVHDVGDYKIDEEWRLLEPGMVMTIEPGIYIDDSTRRATRRWRGTGIRIEDDVVVTRGEPDVLTAKLPSTIEAIEALMS